MVARIVSAQESLSQVLGCESLSVLHQQNEDKATLIHGKDWESAHSLIESDVPPSLLSLPEQSSNLNKLALASLNEEGQTKTIQKNISNQLMVFEGKHSKTYHLNDNQIFTGKTHNPESIPPILYSGEFDGIYPSGVPN